MTIYYIFRYGLDGAEEKLDEEHRELRLKRLRGK